MAQHPLFDITPEHILALDDEGLRVLIARLCKADLRRRGLPVSAVLSGGNQIAADGGIDVRVELPADTAISGFIPRPATGFQAKADDMPAGEIVKEMRPRKPRQAKGTKAPLRASIRALAAAGGAYVIVSSKGSTADSRLAERRDAMRAAVADLDGNDALHLDFYDRTRMADWVGDYPGEVLWVRERIGQALPGWRPFGNWSRAEPVDGAYLSDDTARLWDRRNPPDGPLKVGDGIARLRLLLARAGGIVRLTGISGTGKTRLLEALFDPQIGDLALDPALAVYTDIGAEAPQPSVGQLANRLSAEGKRATLLLDNCPRETHDAIAPVCNSADSAISLITVDLDIRDEWPEHTDVFRLQNASAAVIEALLERRYPKLSRLIRQRIAEFADGNARTAILSAGNVSSGTNLADLGDEGLFERLFHQRRQAEAPLLQSAEVFALVYSFDGEATTGDGAELPVLARIAGLDVRALQRAAGELKRRDIVQSRGRWRAILPQPLANWLAKRALQDLSSIEVADAFWHCGNPRLLKSFTHRLSYLHDSPEAQRIAAAWLAPEGPLADLSEMAQGWTDPRIDLVLHLAPVAPDAVLDLIERYVTGCALDRRKAATQPNRQALMSLLRKLAWFPQHFRRAALCLSRFVQAELFKGDRTQDTRYLEEVFWPLLSGVQAGPNERLCVVEELLVLPARSLQDTGMIALRGMLTAGHFTSFPDFSFGGHAIDFGWRPRTFADYQDWYGGALAIAKRIALSDSPVRGTARHTIAEHFPDLWSAGQICDQLEEAVLVIGTQDHWPEGWLAVRNAIGLHRKTMTADLLARLVRMKERLAPAGLHERIRSYVLTPAHEIAWSAYCETDTPNGKVHEAVVDEARRLGKMAGATLDLFDGDWSDLFGPNAHQAGWFGEGLAEAAVDLEKTWADLLERYRGTDAERRNASLLGGFLRAAASKDNAKVHDWLDTAVRDPLLGPVFPYLQASVGVDENGARRLIDSVESGLAPAGIYWNLCLGRTTEGIHPAVLSRLVLGIAGLPNGHGVALEILHMHFHGERDKQSAWDPSLIDCGRRLLTSDLLEQFENHAAYRLAEIATVCLSDGGSAPAAECLCRRISDATKSGRTSWSDLERLVKRLFALHPPIAGSPVTKRTGGIRCFFSTPERIIIPLMRCHCRSFSNGLTRSPIPDFPGLPASFRHSRTRMMRLSGVKLPWPCSAQHPTARQCSGVWRVNFTRAVGSGRSRISWSGAVPYCSHFSATMIRRFVRSRGRPMTRSSRKLCPGACARPVETSASNDEWDQHAFPGPHQLLTTRRSHGQNRNRPV